MDKFDLIKNSNDFDEAYYSKDLEKMNKLYYKMSQNFEYLLKDLNEIDLIDLDEFKKFMITKYSSMNINGIYSIIEEFKKYWASELPYEKLITKE